MKRVRVNGEVFVTSPLRCENICPGTLVRGYENRRVYRIVGKDNDDYVLRNVRHPDLFEVASASYLMENCWALIPKSPSTP